MERSGPPSRASRVAGSRWRHALIPQPSFRGIWVATALLFLASLFIARGSVESAALLSLLPFAAILAIAALGQMLIIQQGGLDLSVAGTISLTAVLVTKIPEGHDGALPIALAVVFAVALAIGAANGVAVTRLGITPLVATLGMNALLLGAVFQITGGTMTQEAAPALADFAGGKVAGIPATVVCALCVVTVGALVLSHTVAGRRLEAVGVSPRAARAAGVAVVRYQLAAYVLAALSYAVAGVLLAGFMRSPNLTAGDPYLLGTIAAVVLGGTAYGGGRASIVATAVGALFLQQLQQVVLSVGAGNAVQNIVQGSIIAVGMAMRDPRVAGLIRRAAARAGRRQRPTPPPAHQAADGATGADLEAAYTTTHE